MSKKFGIATTRTTTYTQPPTMMLRTSASRAARRANPSALRTITTQTPPAKTPFVHLTPDTVPKETAPEYIAAQHIKKSTGKLGSEIAPFYQPHRALTDPLGPKDVTLELLMASQAHMGHSTSLWNPMNSRYIYGVRAGIHIISLEATAAHLRRAAKVVEGVAAAGGIILFVGTRKGMQRSVVKAARISGGCHLFDRWIPGAITNGTQILGNARLKVVDEFDEEVEKPGGELERKISEVAAVKPDLVVVLNPLENWVALHECGLEGVPTVGIIDTDADPTWVTYPIPANDDSLRCTNLIAGVLGRAGESGRKKRLEAAARGERVQASQQLQEWIRMDKLDSKWMGRPQPKERSEDAEFSSWQ